MNTENRISCTYVPGTTVVALLTELISMRLSQLIIDICANDVTFTEFVKVQGDVHFNIDDKQVN